MADQSTKEGSFSWLWLIAGIVVLAAGFGTFRLLAGTEPPQSTAASGPAAPLVSVTPAEAVQEIFVRQTGFVRPRFAVEVASEVAGRIEKVNEDFRVGALLPEGTELVTLRRDRFEADVKQAEAAVAQARAALDQAETNFSRQTELAEQDFASEARLEEARVGREQASAQLALAEGNLIAAQTALDETVITAPYDALVVEASASLGQILQPGVPVGRLVSAASVEISVGLAPSDLALIGDLFTLRGSRVDIFATDGAGTKLSEGEVKSLDPQIATGSRTVGIIVEVTDPFARDRRSLRLAELVEVSLPVAVGDQVLSIPSNALKARDQVWEVTGEGKLKSHLAEVLNYEDENVAVSLPGLSPGALILTTDLPAPFEGQEVRIRRETAQGTEGQE